MASVGEAPSRIGTRSAPHAGRAAPAIAAAADPGRSGLRGYAWLAGLCAVLTLGSHPPTALLAAPCLGGLALLLGLGWFRGSRQIGAPVLRAILTPLALGAVILVPWVYATLRWSRKLGIIGNYAHGTHVAGTIAQSTNNGIGGAGLAKIERQAFELRVARVIRGNAPEVARRLVSQRVDFERALAGIVQAAQLPQLPLHPSVSHGPR